MNILLFLAVQLLYIITWLPLAILGHIIIPILLGIGLLEQARTGQWPWIQHSKAYNQSYKGFPSWAYVWANEGDSVLGPPEYAARYPKWSEFRRGYVWSAIRNPVNNSRFTIMGIIIDPDKVRWQGTLGNYGSVPHPLYDDKSSKFFLISWIDNTPYFGLLWQYKSPINGRPVKFQTGWKIYPKDSMGFTIPYRASGAGNAMISWQYTD